MLRRRKFDRKLNDESGQALVEYLLLLSLIFTVSVGFSRRIVSALDSSITVFNGTLEKDLRTGRATVRFWEN